MIKYCTEKDDVHQKDRLNLYFPVFTQFNVGKAFIYLHKCFFTHHFPPLQDLLVFLPVGSPLSLSSSIPSSLAATPPSPAPPGPPGSSISSGMNANALPFYPTSETVESVVGEWKWSNRWIPAPGIWP